MAWFTISGYLFAQDSTKPSPLTYSGYAELYYQYDFNNPLNNTRPSSIYSFNRNNETALNLGYIKASYTTVSTRANLALAAGTYINANYSAEPGVLKNVLEANIGVKVSRTADLWVDAGIFPSHIGFETAIGKDCWNLTRSLLAENSPYFESGVKLGYTSPNGKWYLSALLLNGWQRIQRINGNTTPAWGTQVTYKPNENITLNASGFWGNDKPDSVKQMRWFHNFYGILQFHKKCAATVGFDIGSEQKSKSSSGSGTWYSPVLIIKYAVAGRSTIAARAEYYRDKNEVIVATGTPNGFQTWGFSANFDYQVTPRVLWRVEARTLDSRDKIFEKRNAGFTEKSTTITSTIAVNF